MQTTSPSGKHLTAFLAERIVATRKQAIAHCTGVAPNTVDSLLGLLVKEEKLERIATGTYRVILTDEQLLTMLNDAVFDVSILGRLSEAFPASRVQPLWHSLMDKLTRNKLEILQECTIPELEGVLSIKRQTADLEQTLIANAAAARVERESREMRRRPIKIMAYGYFPYHVNLVIPKLTCRKFVEIIPVDGPEFIRSRGKEAVGAVCFGKRTCKMARNILRELAVDIAEAEGTSNLRERIEDLFRLHRPEIAEELSANGASAN